ncbi:MAG: hypothetical protein Q9174_006256, partial [Haloplaca sp. 1 TL-2023]
VPMFGTPNSILATVPHDIHRRRRAAYSNYFSKQSITRYSSVIASAVSTLCLKFEESAKAGKKINLMHAYTAMTGDIVTEYCFPEPYGLLKHPNYAPEYYELWISVLGNSHILKQFPWIFPLMLKCPGWFVDRFLPDLAVQYQWLREWSKQIHDIQTSLAKDSDSSDREKRRGRPSIFETLLTSDLPPFDKSVDRLVEDAQTMVGAGSITTSFALAIGTYYILSSKPIHDKLMRELDTVLPYPRERMAHHLDLSKLERLRYLTATVLEILRISHGVSHRLQRVCPNESIQYKNHVLPPGTPISMTSVLIHNNPSIFPEPEQFNPDRWIPLETTGARLQRYLVAFSKGSRQCLGMHLGNAELMMGIAGVMGRFGRRMRVVDTVWERDVRVQRDNFASMTSKDSTGIQVLIDADFGEG